MYKHMILETPMSFEEFQEKIVEVLKGCFVVGTKIRLQMVQRNNQTGYEGMIILEPGKVVSPVIPLMQYYDLLRAGTVFEDVIKVILQRYQKYQEAEDIDSYFYYDFPSIKPHITYRVVNYKMNQALLQQMPHMRFLDLAVVYSCVYVAGDSTYTSMLIQNSHMEKWETTWEVIHQLAKENTPVLMPYYFENMSEWLNRRFSFETAPERSMAQMYLLTNKYSVQGAACILYEGVLERLAEKLGADFYIIPSSIHEVLLIPDRGELDREGINEMIREVNESQLELEEILSDHAYYYSRKENRILI